MSPLAAELGFHEAVEVTLEDRFDVARLEIGAVVLHQLVRRLHVTADL